MLLASDGHTLTCSVRHDLWWTHSKSPISHSTVTPLYSLPLSSITWAQSHILCSHLHLDTPCANIQIFLEQGHMRNNVRSLLNITTFCLFFRETRAEAEEAFERCFVTWSASRTEALFFVIRKNKSWCVLTRTDYQRLTYWYTMCVSAQVDTGNWNTVSYRRISALWFDWITFNFLTVYGSSSVCWSIVRKVTKSRFHLTSPPLGWMGNSVVIRHKLKTDEFIPPKSHPALL